MGTGRPAIAQQLVLQSDWKHGTHCISNDKKRDRKNTLERDPGEAESGERSRTLSKVRSRAVVAQPAEALPHDRVLVY
jgi:hypothetical protein